MLESDIQTVLRLLAVGPRGHMWLCSLWHWTQANFSLGRYKWCMATARSPHHDITDRHKKSLKISDFIHFVLLSRERNNSLQLEFENVTIWSCYNKIGSCCHVSSGWLDSADSFVPHVKIISRAFIDSRSCNNFEIDAWLLFQWNQWCKSYYPW